MENENTDEQLLKIAAATQIENPIDALKQARALRNALIDEREAEKWSGIARPAKLPASLNEFLKLVVRAKTPADSEKRLRDFYCAEYACFLSKERNKDLSYAEQIKKLDEPVAKPTGKFTKKGRPIMKAIKPFSTGPKAVEPYAANQIKGWREAGFKTNGHWLNLAKRYQAWWDVQKSAKAKDAAQKSVEKRKKITDLNQIPKNANKTKKSKGARVQKVFGGG